MTRRLCLALALTLLACLSLGSQAQAASITGISDQNMVGWDGGANSVYNKINVPQARYITAWDVALHAADNPCEIACQRYNELKAWIEKAEAQGKQIIISFDHKIGCQTTLCPLPSPAGDYRHAVDVFRQKFPNVTEFTAWNEANHKLSGTWVLQPNPYDSSICVENNPATGICGAQAAAKYWIQVNAVVRFPAPPANSAPQSPVTSSMTPTSKAIQIPTSQRSGRRRSPSGGPRLQRRWQRQQHRSPLHFDQHQDREHGRLDHRGRLPQLQWRRPQQRFPKRTGTEPEFAYGSRPPARVNGTTTTS